jgi:hypothetical protein
LVAAINSVVFPAEAFPDMSTLWDGALADAPILGL